MGKLVGTGRCDTAWCGCDRGKQEQEAQSLFRQLTLGLHIQKTGMGERCSEEGIGGGCWLVEQPRVANFCKELPKAAAEEIPSAAVSKTQLCTG